MSIKNAQCRFGLEDDGHHATLYDYATANNIPIGPPLKTEAGVWDTNKVAELIRAGKAIETAFTPHMDRTRLVEEENVELRAALKRAKTPVLTGVTTGVKTPVPVNELTKIEQAAHDFVNALPPNPEIDKVMQANDDFSVALNSVAHPTGEAPPEGHKISEASLETVELELAGETLTQEQRAAREKDKLSHEAGLKTE